MSKSLHRFWAAVHGGGAGVGTVQCSASVMSTVLKVVTSLRRTLAFVLGVTGDMQHDDQFKVSARVHANIRLLSYSLCIRLTLPCWR